MKPCIHITIDHYMHVTLTKGKVVLTRSRDETEPEYEMPDIPQHKPRKEMNIELAECPAYGRVGTDSS